MDVDAYIARFDPEVQRRLEIVRSVGFEVFQNASERIYFAVPTFTSNGRDILNYAAHKKHISLHIGYDLVFMLKDKYPNRSYTKSTIQLPHAEAFPEELVLEICVMLNYFYSNGMVTNEKS